jgi:hypothetical protein
LRWRSARASIKLLRKARNNDRKGLSGREGVDCRLRMLEETLKEHGEILLEHDERISVLESSSALESKRLDNLCQQLSEFSHEIKEMLKSHEERIAGHDLDEVKKEKDIDSLARSVSGILSVIRWGATTLFVLLAGFFIWYVQNLGR